LFALLGGYNSARHVVVETGTVALAKG
jgi:hypothetical protein